MYRLFALSNAMPEGPERLACVAGPPSPKGGIPKPPLPATVVMIPFVSMLRMRLLFTSGNGAGSPFPGQGKNALAYP